MAYSSVIRQDPNSTLLSSVLLSDSVAEKDVLLIVAEQSVYRVGPQRDSIMNREHEAAIRVNVLVAFVEDWRVRALGLEGSGRQKSSSRDLSSGGVRAISPKLPCSIRPFPSEQTGKRVSSRLSSAAIPHTLSAGIAVSPPGWSDRTSTPRLHARIRRCRGIGRSDNVYG